MLYCHGDMKFNASVSDMLVDCSVCARVCVYVCVSVCACVSAKVPDLQIYTKSKSILWLIKWESNVKLSGFNSGSVKCVCVRACALSTPFPPHLLFPR